MFLVLGTFAPEVFAQSTCLAPAGGIVQFPASPNCYTVSPGDTVNECYTFTAPGNILLFTSVPAGSCATLNVSAVLYDSACNMVQPSAFGVVFVTAGSSYVWCIHYVCTGTHDTVFCPVYYDFSAIPVEWLYVNGSYIAQGDCTEINWATASELNNDRFDVQLSAPSGLSFLTLGSVAGSGTTNQIHNYSYRHRHPNPGVSVYRVKQVDKNGRFKYSNAVAVFKPTRLPDEWMVYDIAGRYLGNYADAGIMQLAKGVYLASNGNMYKRIIVIR